MSKIIDFIKRLLKKNNKTVGLFKIIGAFVGNLFIPGTGYFLFKKFKAGIIILSVFIILGLFRQDYPNLILGYMVLVAGSTFILAFEYSDEEVI